MQISRTLYQARTEWMESAPSDQDDDGSNYCEEGGVANLDGNELDGAELERALKLCTAVASLGPVAIKIGQTISQRPDLVGASAAKALKRLQTKNVPFDNDLAYSVLQESLHYCDGPLAPGIPTSGPEIPIDGPTLFAKMTKDPIACASLGQVYRATMHDGTDVAIKVQRPDGLSLLAQDIQCFRIVFGIKAAYEKWKSLTTKDSSQKNGGLSEAEIRGRDDGSVGAVIDRVARDIQKELDYTNEARNSVKFKESLTFLGYVTTPQVVQATQRILMTEWIPGRHLDKLSKEEGLAMTRMAVEACTASMCLTGYVHADPHEGNLMLHDDGRLVFLDFGLMSDVSETVMEGFARGIQGLLSNDYLSLSEAFMDVKFINDPIIHRHSRDDVWENNPNFQLPQLAKDLEASMTKVDGGASQFGALATVLNRDISPRWLCFTPPYVILLCRTFLTLEGIARTVDPDFNIYEISMPWAVRRTLSPNTEKGRTVFRSTLLTQDNKIQWTRLYNLASQNMVNDSTTSSPTIANANSEAQLQRQRDAAKKAAMEDAVGTLLGSSEGKALRRILKDLDGPDLVKRLSSREARPLLKTIMARTMNSISIRQKIKNKIQVWKNDETNNNHIDSPVLEVTAVPIEDRRPISAECQQLRTRQSRWNKRMKKHLLAHHLKVCTSQWNGLKATTKFIGVFIKVLTSTMIKKIFGRLQTPFKADASEAAV